MITKIHQRKTIAIIAVMILSSLKSFCEQEVKEEKGEIESRLNNYYAFRRLDIAHENAISSSFKVYNYLAYFMPWIDQATINFEAKSLFKVIPHQIDERDGTGNSNGKIKSSKKDSNNPNGAIIGDQWNLNDLSNFFDEGLTVKDVLDEFGEGEIGPLRMVDDNITEITYEVKSDKMYENGVRIHTLNIYFKDGKLLNVEVGFAGISH